MIYDNEPEKNVDQNKDQQSKEYSRPPYSCLESLVNYDMYVNGYDPTNKIDIEKYWKERL